MISALLQKPYNEFFKVAVASAGNHDNNIYNDNWSERYHGLKEVPVEGATMQRRLVVTHRANSFLSPAAQRLLALFEQARAAA